VTSRYADLPDDQQVELLSGVVLEAAREFGLDVSDVSLVLHQFNTTFRVDTYDGRRLAVRINTNSPSTANNVVAQQAWVQAVRAQTDVHMARPLATPGGAWYVEVDSPRADRSFLVTANEWLDGEDIGHEAPHHILRALGRTMAILHTQAKGWQLPDGGELPVLDTPLGGATNVLAEVGSPHRRLLASAFETCDRVFAAAYASRTPIACHADLHGGNVKFHDGRLAVFDVDDMGLAVPALDLAISTFYLRDADPAREESLREGYTSIRPLPDDPPEWFEAFVASRQLLLANAMFASTSASWRDEAPAYLDLAAERLQRWLDTGTFTLGRR
jgi:Ser/Thr protein kinase RdoA (MazF antagonist)